MWNRPLEVDPVAASEAQDDGTRMASPLSNRVWQTSPKVGVTPDRFADPRFDGRSTNYVIMAKQTGIVTRFRALLSKMGMSIVHDLCKILFG
jgi:hypothetical protein